MRVNILHIICGVIQNNLSVWIAFSLMVLSPALFAQGVEDVEEFPITLNVQRVGSAEMPALLNGQTAYLPVTDVFTFLRLKSAISSNLDSVSGFFIQPLATYLIDKNTNTITYRGKVFNLKKDDLIGTETNLYLRLNYFSEVFGLDCEFNFRSLSVTLSTKIILPVIQEMMQEDLRKNIRMLRGDKKADTTIKRQFPLLRLGMADWMVINTNDFKKDGHTATHTRAQLNMGAMVLGGETNVSLNYTSGQPFNKTQQLYQWKLVNNDNKLLRQVSAGKIFATSTSSIYAPVTGVQFTNTPTTYRRSFGTYRLSNYTEPGWMVELYVNNILVNYIKADASGFYTFEVPIVYGNSKVQLRFYGPYGEEQVKEQNVVIPFNFLPVNQLEYSLTAGIVGADETNKFYRGNFNYGLTRRFTIGGGVEYLTTANSGNKMPFANASLRIGSNVIVSGEHTVGVRSKGNLTYRLPSNLQLEANYVKYVAGQTAIQFNYLEERKATLLIPIRGKKFAAFSRLSWQQVHMPKVKVTTGEFLLSSMIAGVNTNFTTIASYTDPKHPLVSSNLSLTYRLPKGYKITPQAQYDITNKRMAAARIEIEKNVLSNGFLNVSYDNSFISKNSFVTIGLRVNLSFAQTMVSSRFGNASTSVTQMAKGSIVYADKTNMLSFNQQNSVGKGAIILVPFLDVNCNGRRDAGEHAVTGLNVKINGGRIDKLTRDTTIRITNLEAYSNYFLELDNINFDNVAWQIKKARMNIIIEPNYTKVLQVPIAVVGEVSGYVYNENSAIGAIKVNIYNEASKLVAKVISAADGFFSYMGLAPGKYTAAVDEEQLKKLHYTANSAQAFTVNLNPEGDIVEGLKLLITPQKTR